MQMTKQISAFFFLLHKRAKPALPPYLIPHLRARTQTLYSPLTFFCVCVRFRERQRGDGARGGHELFFFSLFSMYFYFFMFGTVS
jgi:hypothetical protein